MVSATETDNFVEAFDLEHFDWLICFAAIWFQNTSMYHFSMAVGSFIDISICDVLEIEAEVEAVKRVAENLCPHKIVLDRVVLTSTGVLLGLWQVWI